MNSREREVRVKHEGDPNYTKVTPSSRSQWSAHKNPRIVRVSRSFGGKDRHSKVCTIRGLRDRRIRLSVPTAIQLYDLQDKLGLSQPSKVVDWLLDATKNDIDNLPPLPITQFYNPNLAPPLPPPPPPPPEPNPNPNPNPQSSLSQFLASNLGISPSKQGMMKLDNDEREKDKWINGQENINHEGLGGFVAQLSAHNLFPLGNVVNHHHHHHQSPFPNMPNYNPYFHWDHPNLSLSHFGGAYPMPNPAEDQSHNALSTVVPSTSHLCICPTTPTMLPFPPYLAPSMENVQQNLGFSTAIHLMSSSPMRPFVLNVNSKSLHPHQSDAGRSEKGE